MRPVVISRRARADFKSIGDFIPGDDPKPVTGFVAELRVRCRSLSHTPLPEWPALEIAVEARILVFRSYLIPHRVSDEAVLIDRVIHSARDRSGLLPYE